MSLLFYGYKAGSALTARLQTDDHWGACTLWGECSHFGLYFKFQFKFELIFGFILWSSLALSLESRSLLVGLEALFRME
jgi:hypothetical protein